MSAWQIKMEIKVLHICLHCCILCLIAELLYKSRNFKNAIRCAHMPPIKCRAACSCQMGECFSLWSGASVKRPHAVSKHTVAKQMFEKKQKKTCIPPHFLALFLSYLRYSSLLMWFSKPKWLRWVGEERAGLRFHSSTHTHTHTTAELLLTELFQLKWAISLTRFKQLLVEREKTNICLF